MPIYEYRCPRCDHEEEVITKVPIYDYVQCPHCHCDMKMKPCKPSTFIWKEGKPT